MISLIDKQLKLYKNSLESDIKKIFTDEHITQRNILRILLNEKISLIEVRNLFYELLNQLKTILKGQKYLVFPSKIVAQNSKYFNLISKKFGVEIYGKVEKKLIKF